MLARPLSTFRKAFNKVVIDFLLSGSFANRIFREMLQGIVFNVFCLFFNQFSANLSDYFLQDFGPDVWPGF